jgi:hypothetical protein
MRAARAWWPVALGAALLAHLAGCASNNPCTRDYHCPNGQSWHYCDGTPGYYESTDGKHFNCESNTSCKTAYDSITLWCNTAPLDLTGASPHDAAPGGDADAK